MASDPWFFLCHPRVLLVVVGWLIAMPALAAAAGSAGQNGDADHGQQLYQQQCSACHTVDENDVGPAHRGVYGRKAASLRNFEYSAALRHANVVWNDETLDAWLAAPEKFAPGQAMGVSVKDAQARADLIAYLRTLKSAR